MKVLVTGATGFLGGRVARRYAASGAEVLGTGRNAEAGAQLEQDGIWFAKVPLSERDAVIAACADRDLVVHCAALSAPWGTTQDFETANVLGTENVIAGCERHAVPRLVHISTPSLYMSRKSRFAVREDDPLPPPINEYTRTKRIAEERIDDASRRGLSVVSLRPRALFGPGDTVIFPRIARALREKRLPVIGRGDSIVDMTYIENVVDAVLAAASAPESATGRKYNITNGEPISLWDVIATLAKAMDVPLPTKRLPFALAWGLAGASEASYRLMKRKGEPVLTRYGVAVLSCSLTMDISAAVRDLGYVPRVSMDEGLGNFLDWWKTQ
ncbi:MAG: nucleoside-diphosphate-sugar epimerase [Polyangiales bacterium]|jgi:nucleoside-diphosphate-sugar epimerase